MSGEPLLSIRGASKAFPGVQALRDVDLSLHAGEVLAVIGENGAGKSTLMKIIGGILAPDAGEILIDGERATIRSVADAQRLGISIIHQELDLAENLDIAENLFLGRQPTRGPFGWRDRRALYAGAEELLSRVGLRRPPRTIVGRLSPGEKQLVEIAKALSLRARAIIFDEPTSSLSSAETERLFALIAGLRARGMGVIYISHRLAEVARVADRVQVLRDGACAGRLAREEIDHDRMVRLMVGRSVSQYYRRVRPESPPAAHGATEATALEVRGLRIRRGADPIDLRVRAGEIVGLAGLVGAGRTEFARAVFGADRPAAGEVLVRGRPARIRAPRDAIAAGIGLVPEDRKAQGLILEMAVRINISLAGLRRYRPFALLDRRRERAIAERMVDRLRIRTPSIEQKTSLLSGGNQQKVVLARWLALEPSLLILDEPTRGVDVGARAEIYALMSELTASGVGILMVSSEMEEVRGMSDRVAVMRGGTIAGILEGEGIAEEAILRLAVGPSEGSAA
ncbi:MAG: sugar ABC transporter ATP-binding protein [Planctomycetes bacterium]|nr:sugar ABC transporter ATP-binding protein [Planctomycetota bacterium]